MKTITSHTKEEGGGRPRCSQPPASHRYKRMQNGGYFWCVWSKAFMLGPSPCYRIGGFLKGRRLLLLTPKRLHSLCLGGTLNPSPLSGKLV